MAPWILFPIFFLSLACTAYGFLRVRNKVKLSLIVFAGLPVLGIAFPLAVVVINGLSGGMIESRVNLLWSFVKLLTINGGDIYMGAGGFMLAVIAIVFLVFQLLLVREKETATLNYRKPN